MAKNKNVTWLVCTMALLMSIALVDAQTYFNNGRYGKRTPDFRFRVASRSPEERFFGGPRFGRSGAVVLNNNEIDRNPERFFIGSRYGKRSADSVEQVAPVFQQDDQQSTLESLPNSDDKDVVLVCYPIGFEQFYHCERKNDVVKSQEVA